VPFFDKAFCRIFYSEVPMAQENTVRFAARIPKNVHVAIKHAAQLKGRTVSDFVVSAAHDAALRAIADEKIIRLVLADQRRLAQALIRPPKPNAALRRANKLHTDNVEVR
jgi:uncharacterized protein (DUF1778 family)